MMCNKHSIPYMSWTQLLWRWSFHPSAHEKGNVTILNAIEIVGNSWHGFLLLIQKITSVHKISFFLRLTFSSAIPRLLFVHSWLLSHTLMRPRGSEHSHSRTLKNMVAQRALQSDLVMLSRWLDACKMELKRNCLYEHKLKMTRKQARKINSLQDLNINNYYFYHSMLNNICMILHSSQICYPTVHLIEILGALT